LTEEISRRLPTSVAEKGTLTYFFCQGTIDGPSDAIPVVRGLIYVLVDQRRDSLPYVVRTDDNEGGRLSKGSNGLCGLRKLLLDIAWDPFLPRVYSMIDVLDEYGAHQAELLGLLNRGNAPSRSTVKWLITSP
jgi:hypothetical protein